jgi:hypothetical protein
MCLQETSLLCRCCCRRRAAPLKVLAVAPQCQLELTDALLSQQPQFSCNHFQSILLDAIKHR